MNFFKDYTQLQEIKALKLNYQEKRNNQFMMLFLFKIQIIQIAN